MPSSGHQRPSSRSEEAGDEEFSSEEEEAQPYSSSSPRPSAHHSKASGSIRSPVVSPKSGNLVQMPSGGSYKSPAEVQWELYAANAVRPGKPIEPYPAASRGFAPKERKNKKGKTKNSGPAGWRTQKTTSGKVMGLTRRKGEGRRNVQNWGVVIKGNSDDPRSNRHVGCDGGPLSPRSVDALKRRAEATTRDEKAERRREEEEEVKEMKREMRKAIKKKKKKQSSSCVMM